MEKMHELKKRFEKELAEYMPKGDRITMAELETIHKLTDTIKNIDKIEMLEEGGEYSHNEGYSRRGGDWEARGSYRGGSGGGGGGSYEGGSSQRGGSYEGGSSQRRQRRDSRGRYSREGGYSYDDGMAELNELLDELMEDADERTRNAIHRFRQELKR